MLLQAIKKIPPKQMTWLKFAQNKSPKHDFKKLFLILSSFSFFSFLSNIIRVKQKQCKLII